MCQCSCGRSGWTIPFPSSINAETRSRRPFQHPVNRGRTHRHHVHVEHLKGQSSVPFERMASKNSTLVSPNPPARNPGRSAHCARWRSHTASPNRSTTATPQRAMAGRRNLCPHSRGFCSLVRCFGDRLFQPVPPGAAPDLRCKPDHRGNAKSNQRG